MILTTEAEWDDTVDDAEIRRENHRKDGAQTLEITREKPPTSTGAGYLNHQQYLDVPGS